MGWSFMRHDVPLHVDRLPDGRDTRGSRRHWVHVPLMRWWFKRVRTILGLFKTAFTVPTPTSSNNILVSTHMAVNNVQR